MRAPRLSTFSLSRLRTVEEAPPPSHIPTVSLPELANLELTELPLSYAPWLIQHIESRPCQTFAVDINLADCDATAIMRRMASFMPEEVASSDVKLDVWADGVDLFLWLSNGDYYHIRLGRRPATTLLEHLVVHLPSWFIARPVRAALHGTVYADPSPFFATLWSFRIINLDIKHASGIREILMQLTSANEVDGVKIWRCRELERLSFDCSGTILQALRAMVEARYGLTPSGGDAPTSPPTGGLPTSLQSLLVANAPLDSERDCQALKRIVGEGKVTWGLASVYDEY